MLGRRCVLGLLSRPSLSLAQVIRVSEGHKLSLGGVLIEVLYPPQSFYDALHSPIALKKMLKRKVPENWDYEREERETSNARTLSMAENEARLAGSVNQPQMLKEGMHLSDLSDPPDEFQQEGRNVPEIHGDDDGIESDTLPWKMVGTIYNNLSIVVKVTFLGGISSPSILFPGDLSDWTTLVLRQWPNLRASWS